MKEDLRLFLPKADLERLMHLLSKTDPSFFLLYHNFSLEIFPINDSLFVFLFLPSLAVFSHFIKKKKTHKKLSQIKIIPSWYLAGSPVVKNLLCNAEEGRFKPWLGN